MSLADHFRELRNRVVVAGLAILAGAVVGWIYYDPIINRLIQPLKDVAAERGDTGLVNINFGTMTDAFAIKITVALFVGLILASPVWLMQIWGFVVPGLTKKEKRVTRLFVVAAVPLFVAGCAAAFVMDEPLLYGERTKAKSAGDWVVVGAPLQTENYACMFRKDDASFKKLADGVIADLQTSGRAEKLYNKWFMAPIPPRNINMNYPLSADMKALFAAPNDKAYQ